MSQVIKNRNNLIDKKRNAIIKIIILISLFFLTSYMIFLQQTRWGLNIRYLVIPIALFLIPSLYYFIFFLKINGFMNAQNKAFNDLKYLSDKFTIMQNVYLPYERKVVACDYIIIGHQGVFVVDIKNSGGMIYESTNPRYWIHIAKNKKGKKRTINNPFINVRLKVVALRQYLKKYEITAHIEGLVYFNGKNVILEIPSKASYKVFGSKKDLLKYIEERETNREIDEVKKKNIIQVLTHTSVR